MKKIKSAIVGYGNVGKKLEQKLAASRDFEVFAIFSNHPAVSPLGSQVLSSDDIERYSGKIDVLFLCVGSSQDAPTLAPRLARHFNIVDCYDNHDNLESYIESVGTQSKAGKKVAICATGWDPGLFSLFRGFMDLFVGGHIHTFFGPGISQGHGNAIRQLDGVERAAQITAPRQDALKKVKAGEAVEKADMHERQCFVVAQKTAQAKIEKQIRTMPSYFAGQQTKVTFVSSEEFEKEYANRAEHGGTVLAQSKEASAQFLLALQNNASFTSHIMMVYARAISPLRHARKYGAHNVFEIPIYFLAKNKNDMQKLL